MAKRGLAFWFVMSFGFNIVGYLFYLHFKYTPKEYLNEHPMDTLKKLEDRDVFLSENQIRMLPERSVVKSIPVVDDIKDKGYM
jgi:hypothetical protein